jgi:hypothetical protein
MKKLLALCLCFLLVSLTSVSFASYGAPTTKTAIVKSLDINPVLSLEIGTDLKNMSDPDSFFIETDTSEVVPESIELESTWNVALFAIQELREVDFYRKTYLVEQTYCFTDILQKPINRPYNFNNPNKYFNRLYPKN